MIADVVRRVAVRHLPQQLAAIEVDRREHAVRRLHDRAAPARSVRRPEAQQVDRRCAGRRRGRRRRRCSGRRCRCRRGFGLRDGARRIGGAAVAGPEHFDERLAGDAAHVADVGEARRRRHQRVRVMPGVRCLREGDVRLRIVAAARPVGAAAKIADVQRAEQAVDVAEDRRVEQRPRLVARQLSERLRPQLRREVDEVVRDVHEVARVRRRLGRETAASASTSRRARRTAAPAALRSATPAGRSRDRTRRGRPACSAPPPP